MGQGRGTFAGCHSLFLSPHFLSSLYSPLSNKTIKCPKTYLKRENSWFVAGWLLVQFPGRLGKYLRTNATLSMSHQWVLLQGAHGFPRLYSLTGIDVHGVSLMCGLWRAASFEAGVKCWMQPWDNQRSEEIAKGHSQALTLPSVFTEDWESLSRERHRLNLWAYIDLWCWSLILASETLTHTIRRTRAISGWVTGD